MSQLVFQANAGGSITLNGTNTAGTYNLTVPADNGTLLYEDGSGNISVTNLDVTGDLTITGTSALGIPVGNTAERPSPVEAGQIRYNTDGGGLYEAYLPAEGEWWKFVMAPEGEYPIQYFIVGGGGGGQNGGYTGAGGAGQVIASTHTAIPGTVFTITIGGGGAAQTVGGSTTIVGVSTAIGGGAGYDAGGGTSGSHGGASGNGYSGGLGLGTCGGGGSSANNSGNNGGAGTTTLIQGGSITVAGGGGGGSASGPGGQGSGAAGGGTGGWANFSGDVAPTNGNPNTGSGGGGAALNFPHSGGQGGSGLACLRMATASYTGTTTGSPTIIVSGTDTVLVYNSSGTYTA